MLEFIYCNTEKFDNWKCFFTIYFALIDDVHNVIIPSSIQNRKNILEKELAQRVNIRFIFVRNLGT